MFNDESGQLMLISAFLLAITVVTITLMLNNIIYATNMAYVGFMDQSWYDNLCLKQATAAEANYAYTNDREKYQEHMDDYVKALNNITSIKGRYVEYKNEAVTDHTSPLPVTETKSLFSIYGKGSSISFEIYTGKNNVPVAPTPGPAPGPGPEPSYKITLAPLVSSVVSDNTDKVLLTATVRYVNGSPVPAGTLVYISPDANRTGGNIIDTVSGTSSSAYATDSSGVVSVYYLDSNNTPGSAYIYARVGSNVSNTARIDCTPPPSIVCKHNPTVNFSGSSIINTNGNHYEIKVKLSVDPLTNVTINRLNITSSSIEIDKPDPYFTQTTSEINIAVKKASSTEFTIELELADIKGYCTTDNVPYSSNATMVIQGTESSLNSVSITYI